MKAEVCVDPMYMLLMIPPKFSVQSVIGYFKGKSSLMIYDKWGYVRYK